MFKKFVVPALAVVGALVLAIFGYNYVSGGNQGS